MKRKITAFAAALCVVLTVFVIAADVTITAPDGTEKTVSVDVPEGGGLWTAFYDAGGVMVGVDAADGGAVRAADGAAYAKVFALSDGYIPESAPERVVLDPLAWQYPYKDGLKYLSAQNYWRAAAFFTEAIGLDPDQPPPYVGRGDACIGMGETEENLTAAQADYETANGLDSSYPEAWLGLADVEIRRGEYDRAEDILTAAAEATDNAEAVSEKLEQVRAGRYIDSVDHERRVNEYDPDGTLTGFTDYHYDAAGNRTGWSNYNVFYNPETGEAGEPELDNYCMVERDEAGRHIRTRFYDPEDRLTFYDEFTYNEAGQKARQDRYTPDDTLSQYFLYYYENGLEVKVEDYFADGRLYQLELSFYDEAGNLIREEVRTPEGDLEFYYDYT